MTAAVVLHTEGVNEGMEIGRVKGRNEETLKIARNMLLEGYKIATIMKLTKISEEALDSL